MDSLVVVLILLGVLSSVIKWVQKATKQKSDDSDSDSDSDQSPVPSEARRQPTAEGLKNELQKYGDPFIQAPKAVDHKAYRPIAEIGGQERKMPFPTLAEGESYRVGGIYAGSMGLHIMEGVDLCDPALGHGEAAPMELVLLEEVPVRSQWSFQWQGNALAQGVVMSEILTRRGYRPFRGTALGTTSRLGKRI